MKLTTSILVIALAASASAQQKPAEQAAPVKSGTVNMAPAKPTAATQAKPAAAPAKVVAKPAAATVAQPATKAPVSVAKAPVATKPAVKKVQKSAPKTTPKVDAKATEAAAAPEVDKTPKRVAAIDKSKRDPFQTIVREHSASGGVCSGAGKQCLVPDEIALKGIVRSNGAIIAVVTTKDNRAYFLRENDPVMNGVVEKISEGSITFREKTTDIFGKTVMREVVKKITNTAA